MKIKMLLLTCCLASSLCCAKESTKVIQKPVINENVGEPEKELISDQNKIENYFLKTFNDNTRRFTESQVFNSNEIDKYRKEIWKYWVDANNKYAEQKLIDLKPLDEEKNSKWNLPGNLEPNAVMPYYYGYKGEKPAAGYPLFIYTHGSGPKAQEWANGIRLCREFEDAPSIYFIPQIPNEGQYYRWWQKSKQWAWDKLLRLSLINENIDPHRIYIFGISEGGYGSQRLASFYADYLAAAGPMAGGEPLMNAPVENCSNIGFSLRTGANDFGFHRNQLTKNTNEAFDKLEKANPGYFKHWIELIPGRGHGIDYFLTTPWLKDFKRNANPKKFWWEDYDMDGQYRQGFYNLYVKQSPNPTGRVMYAMDIQGNKINLKVDNVEYTVAESHPSTGIPLRFNRKFTPSTTGKLVIYLGNELVDLSKPVIVNVNGKEVFNGMVKCDVKNLINSCSIFYDPLRLYPAAVEISL